MRFESADSLVDERNTVAQEEHALSPVATHKEIGEGDDRARLPSSRCHDQERFALLIGVERLADPPNRASLIVALDNSGADLLCGERFARRPSLDDELELIPRIEALNLPR